MWKSPVKSPKEVDVNAVCGALPYSQFSAKSVRGGLKIAHPARPDGAPTIVAHAAIIVSDNLIKKQARVKRLILETGSGADLYGQDFTKAVLRALDDALRYSSIFMFSTLGLNYANMKVNVRIGVHQPMKVNVGEITAAVPHDAPV